MATLEIIPADESHIASILQTFRQADRDEVWASSLLTPSEALHVSLSLSAVSWSMTVDGVPFCMFGVAAASPGCRHGIPWLLGGNQIEENAFAFARISKRGLKNVLRHYQMLSNVIDARNETAIRWLKWLGFSILPATPYGPFNLPFHPFEMRS